jgi:hypothetical protein
MKGAVMVTQTFESEPDGIVGIDRNFGTGAASQGLFAKARPVYPVPSKRAGLHLIERTVQVCNRVCFRRVAGRGLGLSVY